MPSGVLGQIFRALKGWIAPLFSTCAKFLANSNFLQNVSWRKVLFAVLLASFLVAFSQVLISFSKSLETSFRLVFQAVGGNVVGGSGASLGVLSWFGLGRVFDLASAIPGFARFCYIFGIDWILWAASECLLLWLVDVGLRRIMVWAGTLVRVAYDAL